MIIELTDKEVSQAIDEYLQSRGVQGIYQHIDIDEDGAVVEIDTAPTWVDDDAPDEDAEAEDVLDDATDVFADDAVGEFVHGCGE